jgi:hypothetical protein
METSELKRLDTPLAKKLAETLVLQRDMQRSLDAIELWHAKYAEKEPGTEDAIIGQSLFRDAIILFVGCFDKSAEFPLSANDIYGHHPKGLSSFEWFQNMRDGYAAHKFGAQRQCVVGVIQSPTGEIGIGQLFAAYRGQLKSDGPQLIGFMKTAARHLDQKVERLSQDLLEYAQKMKPEEIAALPRAEVHTLSQEESKLTRSGILKARAGKPVPTRKR